VKVKVKVNKIIIIQIILQWNNKINKKVDKIILKMERWIQIIKIIEIENKIIHLQVNQVQILILIQVLDMNINKEIKYKKIK
jgi:hypothetical protein